MKAFGYARVSGAAQVEGDGEARQLDAIKQFCAANLLPLAAHAFEAGVSGTVEAMDRPAFSDLLAFTQPGDAIVVERLDRLARDLMIQEFLLKECRSRGVKVFATDQGAPLDLASNDIDPTRKLIRQILGALAEWEKSALVLKLRKSRDRIRREKGFCEGLLAYGTDPRRPKEVYIFQIIKQQHAEGRSYREIANLLNGLGFFTRFNRTWTKETVRAIIKMNGVKQHERKLLRLAGNQRAEDKGSGGRNAAE